MKFIDEQRDEHQKILKMLDYLEGSLAPYSQPNVRRAVHFFAEWMLEFHNPRQEVLFGELVSRSADVCTSVVQTMRRDHALAAAYLRKIVEQLARSGEGDRRLLLRYCDAFTKLLREHVQREDKVFFTLCHQLVPPSVDAEIMERLDSVVEGCLAAEVLQAHMRIADNPHDTRVVRAVRSAPRRPASETAPQTKGAVVDAKTLSGGAVENTDESVFSAQARWTLYDQDGHQNIRLHDFGQGLAVQANTFLIVNNNQGMLLDPGGPKVFPNVLAETMMVLDKADLRWLFLSHQDPDICTALNAWLMDTKADAMVSKLWTRFLPHFGIDRLMKSRLKSIPDEGMFVELGKTELMILPAHFLHSCGNFQIYDPISKVLFSGDLGASVGAEGSSVEDFDAHLKYMRGFHRRYMGGNTALRAWADMVEKLDVEVIAPQHGLALKGAAVQRFLDWCRDLKCGLDFSPEMFRLPTTRTFAS